MGGSDGELPPPSVKLTMPIGFMLRILTQAALSVIMPAWLLGELDATALWPEPFGHRNVGRTVIGVQHERRAGAELDRIGHHDGVGGVPGHGSVEPTKNRPCGR